MNRISLLFTAMLAASCTPTIDIHASRITDARVIAVRADPPEAPPGANVTFRATVATPMGAVDDVAIDWDFCLVPRSPDESTTVASFCLGEGMLADGGNALVPIVTGHAQVMTMIPSDACRRVGPQVPPASMNGTRQRPPDPDITGGYQLPVRLTLESNGAVAFARERLRCSLPDAPADVARAYQSMYRNNTNPTLDEVDAQIGTVSTALAPIGSGPAMHANPGATLGLTAHWAPSAVETYVLVDPATRMLASRTEQLEVTWFTNGGSFAHDRTGPDATALASTNSIRIDADRTDPVTIWVVLRDDRGGTDVRTYVVAIH